MFVVAESSSSNFKTVTPLDFQLFSLESCVENFFTNPNQPPGFSGGATRNSSRKPPKTVEDAKSPVLRRGVGGWRFVPGRMGVLWGRFFCSSFVLGGGFQMLFYVHPLFWGRCFQFGLIFWDVFENHQPVVLGAPKKILRCVFLPCETGIMVFGKQQLRKECKKHLRSMSICDFQWTVIMKWKSNIIPILWKQSVKQKQTCLLFFFCCFLSDCP